MSGTVICSIAQQVLRWRSFGVVATLDASLILAAGPAAAETVAIVGGRIIDGTGGAPIVDGVVLIEDDRIKAVGREGEIAIPKSARVVDANGMTVMPGLVDVHVHFDILGHADYDHWFGTYEDRMRTDILPAAARAMLRAGVTSVRDLGSDIDNIFWLRDEVDSGRIQGPRTFIAGPFLRKSTTAFVSKSYVDTWVIDGPDDAREKVRTLKEMGVDVIKTQDEALTRDELAAIYDEAHSLGLRVASHIYAAEAVRTALEAGLGEYDTIEHIGVDETLAYDPDIVRMIVDNKVAMAPTIIALEGLGMIIENPELTDDPRWRRDVPADLYADIRRSYRENDLSKHSIYRRAIEDKAGRFSKLKDLKDKGAIFAISSDSGTRGNPHHNAMWREMALTHEVTGMSSMEVIVAATAINAKILGTDDNIGTLEPGKYADILVVDGDPLTNLSDMRRIRHIFKGGVRVD